MRFPCCEVWLSLDHDSIASTGYKQTGPTMSLAKLEGGVSPTSGEDLGLYKDLVPFWARIDGDAIYRDAVKHVEDMWNAGVLSAWSDCTSVVEAHAPHRPIDEGLEGIGCDIEDENEAAADPDADAAETDEAAVDPEGRGAMVEVLDADAKPVRSLYVPYLFPSACPSVT